ncbi:MAG: SIS domain-containing protein [Candidatus Hodarchaeales archaeon]|jgi:glucosamine--fructose-6-phosphate aminotransferase (isomerizing)
MTQPDFMLTEILEQPLILNSIFADENLNILAESIKAENYQKIILTGCGDSYCASWFGNNLAKRWCTHYQVEYFEPFELVNYVNPKELKNALVIGISVSGGTLRVLEAIRFAKFHGAMTLVITDNSKGKLVNEANKNVLINASPQESLLTTSYSSETAKKYVGYQNDVAQTKTFIANLGTLSVLFAHLSTRSTSNLKKVKSTFSLVGKALDQRDEIIQLGKSFKDFSENIFFLASGPDAPTGLFGAYKMFEFTLHGFSCDIEEYCHTRYFITTDKSTVILLASDKQSYDRIMEIEPVLREYINANTLILANEIFVDQKLTSILPFVLPEDPYLAPLVQTIPIELISYSLARSKGFNTNTFRGGVETEKYVTGSYKTIRQSHLQF